MESLEDPFEDELERTKRLAREALAEVWSGQINVAAPRLLLLLPVANRRPCHTWG
jgi:hypothetical protein